MKIEQYICDVCDKEMKSGYKKENIQVVFHTEQTEGRSCPPYLSMVYIDICDMCLGMIMNEGKSLHASGAQGNNNYYFNN